MDQKAIREQLLIELKNLMGRSDRIDAHWRDEPPLADWSEWAIRQENEEVINSLDGRTQEEIIAVKQTLRRMDAGEWGACADCGADIQEARLEAIPTATLCVSCAEAREE
jgi:RNA polymerase-binding protein DksA